jgi:hypothetical protein
MIAKKSSLLFLVFVLTMIHSAIAQNITVSGKITDPQGNPVVSASVRVKNSKQGTSSDSLGIFTIKVKSKAALLFSAIGFADTTVYAEDRNNLVIVLKSEAKALKEVVVSGVSQNTGLPSGEEATKEQIIANTFENYLRGAEFSNGIYVSSTYSPKLVGNVVTGDIVRTTISGFGALNTINSGAMLPVVEHKEETRGSRYLLSKYAKGVIVDSANSLISDSINLLNYDKIDGQLMIAQNVKNYLEVDKEKVLAFALKADDTSFIFLNVPILSKTNYFLLIANGPKYSAYKSIRSKFVKSNYISNGLVETGNNYDEYVDKLTYYWVDEHNKIAGIFELKKKSITEAFAAEKEKTNTFFAKHKHDDFDDNLIRNLIMYLNQ